jgi:6-phosphofructokinase 1
MKKSGHRRLGILTGGGDVAPLNAVIASVRQACASAGIGLTGFARGWQGLLERKTIDLTRHEVNPLIGGTILKSSRVNLASVPGAPDAVREACRKMGLDGLIVIGGEDTLSNAFHIADMPQVLISKTIDNDVGKTLLKKRTGPDFQNVVNHFTLGHPTAAAKISSFVSLEEGMRTTAYSHERLIVVESMGMHAGWLALSSCMGNPDFIIVPEFPLDYESFLGMVAARYRKQRHCIIVVAEGARWKDGSYVSADESEKDSFGHPRFKGAGAALAAKLKQDLKKDFDTRNVNSVNPSYLYRSGAPCKLDADCATKLGREAVRLFAKGLDHPLFVTLSRSQRGFAVSGNPLNELGDIEDFHRFLNTDLYDAEKLNATQYARGYWSTMVRPFALRTYGHIF